MNIKDKFKGLKFQEGGEVPQTPQENPQEQLLEAINQAISTQDCELSLQILQALQEQLGGTQPEAPVFKKGGVMKEHCKKAKKLFAKNGMKLKAKKGKLVK